MAKKKLWVLHVLLRAAAKPITHVFFQPTKIMIVYLLGLAMIFVPLTIVVIRWEESTPKTLIPHFAFIGYGMIFVFIGFILAYARKHPEIVEPLKGKNEK